MNTPALLRALTENLIDYAGLFPPASLEMKPAVRNFASYVDGESSWILARFITPVAKLYAFQNAFDELESASRAWRISALSSSESFNEDLRQVLDFNCDNDSRAVIDAFEIKVETADEIKLIISAIEKQNAATSFDVFFELALNRDLSTLARAAKNSNLKIRTGGVEAAQIPTSASVLNFIRTCHQYDVSFKATAGLHHPLRAEQNLTYETSAPRAVMHGFLNIFLAAAFIYDGIDEQAALQILEETDVSSFAFGDAGVTWHEYKISTEKIELARKNFALSFGSCSFTEPIEDLRAFKLL